MIWPISVPSMNKLLCTLFANPFRDTRIKSGTTRRAMFRFEMPASVSRITTDLYR